MQSNAEEKNLKNTPPPIYKNIAPMSSALRICQRDYRVQVLIGGKQESHSTSKLAILTARF